MAMEDGLVLGTLLGRLSTSEAIPAKEKREHLHNMLLLFEKLRKPRTTLGFEGAIAMRDFYQMQDGPEQEQRDKDLAEIDWNKPCRWHWADPSYQKNLLGFDTMKDSNDAFARWIDDLRTA